MDVTLKDLICLVKELPEESYDEIYQKLQETLQLAQTKQENASVVCVHCGGNNIYRNGKHNGKQVYRCKDCGRTFLKTATSAIAYSHSNEATWKQVIRDTVDGLPIDKTASALCLAHSTVFNMRHKILTCLEDAILGDESPLDGLHEADETYVLEDVKGVKIPEDYHRKPRRHGAKALKRGLSDEYICICTSVGEDNRCIATSVNRASPTKEALNQVFGEKVGEDTVILCDGNRNYDVLEDKCTVAHTARVNRVNGFHNFIKRRLEDARGVSTKYLNRYNALFAEVYGDPDAAVDKIYALMTARTDSFTSIADVKEKNLLEI